MGSRFTAGPAPRLRIGFVYDALIPYLSGGAERRLHELATRLATSHEVHVVSWSYWGAQPMVVEDGITYHGVGSPRPLYGADGKRTIREAAEFAIRSMPVVRSLDVDVIDVSATPYLPLFSTWLATRASPTSLVVTWHEFWGEHWSEYLPDRPLVARTARLLESASRRLGERRVAVSPLTARRLRGSSASPPTSAAVVENGVDLARIDGAAPDPRSSDVICVGRLIDEKRVDVLLRAIAILAATAPGLRCRIVGEGPDRERLEAVADDLGLRRHVSFLGRVPEAELAGLLKSARVLAMPSLREGFGIVVVEAQAAGAVPVVARGPFTAAPDLIDDGRNGVTCGGTADGLAAAIGWLLADEPRRAAMAAGARASARGRTWDDRAREMERLYVEVARPRAAASARELGLVEPRTDPA